MGIRYRNLVWLSLFAIAMAQVEASVVVHLRTIYYPGNPLAIFPLSLLSSRDLMIEMVRELATVVMIMSVAFLNSRGFALRFATFVYVFGMWDLFFYIWLKIMIDWPPGWLEWDVLFLIPWPWLGPWLTPALIALLFVIWGGWVIASGKMIRFSRANTVLFVSGTTLALAAFLLPAVPLLRQGEEAFRQYQPHAFLWQLYIPGYLLMTGSLWRVARDARLREDRANEQTV